MCSASGRKGGSYSGTGELALDEASARRHGSSYAKGAVDQEGSAARAGHGADAGRSNDHQRREGRIGELGCRERGCDQASQDRDQPAGHLQRRRTVLQDGRRSGAEPVFLYQHGHMDADERRRRRPRSHRANRSDRSDWGGRADRHNGRNGCNRNDRVGRSDRGGRADRRNGHNRSDRNDRADWAAGVAGANGADRSDRSHRFDGADRADCGAPVPIGCNISTATTQGGITDLLSVTVLANTLAGGDTIHVWALYTHTGGTTNIPRYGLTFGGADVIPTIAASNADTGAIMEAWISERTTTSQDATGRVQRIINSGFGSLPSVQALAIDTGSDRNVTFRGGFTSGTGENNNLRSYCVVVYKAK